MENETQEEMVTQVEQKSSLYQVTPLSKYLALALFVIFPFVGGWIGYTYAPEKVVEVENVVVQKVTAPVQSQSVMYSSDFISEQSSSTKRLLLSRQELFANEDGLYNEFALDKNWSYKREWDGYLMGGDNGGLYQLRNKDVEQTYVYYQGNGISLLLPYNEGYGYPYYRLTPYDENENGITYGEVHPCPEGCLEKGGVTSGITFYPAGSLQEQIQKMESGEAANCETKTININTEGLYCTQQAMMGDRVLFIEGTKHLYGIRDFTNAATSLVYKSMVVE
jgi:hypothetical protein